MQSKKKRERERGRAAATPTDADATPDSDVSAQQAMMTTMTSTALLQRRNTDLAVHLLSLPLPHSGSLSGSRQMKLKSE